MRCGTSILPPNSYLIWAPAPFSRCASELGTHPRRGFIARAKINYWLRKATSSRLSRRRFVGGAAATGVGAAGLALVGCGDDDDDDSGPAATNTSAPAATAAPTNTLAPGETPAPTAAPTATSAPPPARSTAVLMLPSRQPFMRPSTPISRWQAPSSRSLAGSSRRSFALRTRMRAYLTATSQRAGSSLTLRP